jgi:glucans biosynthesis protein C
MATTHIQAYSINDSQPKSQKGERRYYLDWLRVILILLVFLFHVGRFFDEIWWHVKDNNRSKAVTTFVLLVSLWGMPFLFLVSGAATRFALLHIPRARSYLTERFKRLMIPFLFGIIIIVPPQVYFERLQKGEFTGSYLQFFPHYFDGLYFFDGNFSWIGHHLWFLLVLFVISAMTLPLLLALQGDRGRPLVAGVAALCDRTESIHLLAIPVIIIKMVFGTVGISDPFIYILFFIFGYVLFSDSRLERLVAMSGQRALIMAIASSALYGTGYYLNFFSISELSSFSLKNAAFQSLAGINCWAWTVALLSIGMRYLNKNNQALKYANEAVMPFYVLHQTVIIFFGYYIIQLHIGMGKKYIFITLLSLFTTVCIYELIVKRFSFIRWLFGMRTK